MVFLQWRRQIITINRCYSTVDLIIIKTCFNFAFCFNAGSENHLAISRERYLHIASLADRKFIYNMEVYKKVTNEDDSDSNVDAVTFNVSGSRLMVSECMENNLKIFNVKKGRLIKELKGISVRYRHVTLNKSF